VAIVEVVLNIQLADARRCNGIKGFWDTVGNDQERAWCGGQVWVDFLHSQKNWLG
ncbi:hypothetical protein PCANC_09605, partial [Puccinia coronata f. sp. avenae]